MTLLERGEALDTLGRSLADASGGRGRLVCVSGEAGVGKTSLVRAFADGLDGRARVLWGACEDLAAPEPLGPLRDVFRDGGWDLSAGLAEAPSMLAIFSRVLRELDRIGEVTLAVIEDIHWADDATVDLVRYLGRRLHGAHLLLVVTARDDESDGRIRTRRALSDVPRDALERLALAPLSEDGVARLAAGRGRPATGLYALTAGNPFYVTEALSVDVGASPPTVRDAVLARASKLSAEARGLLDRICVVPRRAEYWLVEALCGEECVEALDACIVGGMLRAEGDTVAFRHEIARRAVESVLGPSRRRKTHAMVFAALDAARPRASITRLVYHAEGAGHGEVVRRLAARAAAEASRVGAHRVAAEHYAASLRHCAHRPPAERAELHERSSYELHLIGRVDEAIAARETALELRRALGDRLKEGEGLRWLSRLGWLAGRRGPAERLAAAAVAILETLDPGPELAMAYSNRSQLHMLAHDRHEALEWGNRAIVLAERLGDESILAHALNNVGVVKWGSDAASGRGDLERSLAIALASDLQEHAARAYTNIASSAVGCRDYETAFQALEDGVAYTTERDLDTWRGYMRGWLARAHLETGAWEAAARTARLVLDEPDAAPLVRNPSVLAMAGVRVRRGEPGVEALFAEMEEYLAGTPEIARIAPYVCLRAERAWLGGAAPAAERDRVAATMDEALAHGDGSLAAELLVWLRRLGGDACGRVRAVGPHALLLRGDWDGAAAAWRDLGCPYDEALALMAGGEAAQRRALEILERLGARPAAERLRRRMRERGVKRIPRGARASTRANRAGLTRRQMDVLGLIDEGLSNADIAARLFVSPKTVDHHVSAILAKLEAASRGEAAAAARRLGLLGGAAQNGEPAVEE